MPHDIRKSMEFNMVYGFLVIIYYIRSIEDSEILTLKKINFRLLLTI